MLISTDGRTFTITFRYNPQHVAAIKTIPGRRYDPQRRVWTAPVSSVRAVNEFSALAGIPMTADARAVPDTDPATPSVTFARTLYHLRFEYDRDIVAWAKDIPGARWDKAAHCWTVPTSSDVEVLEFVQHWKANVDPHAWDCLAGARAAVVKIARSASRDATLPPIPGFVGDLLPFQRAGVAYVLEALGRRTP